MYKRNLNNEKCKWQSGKLVALTLPKLLKLETVLSFFVALHTCIATLSFTKMPKASFLSAWCSRTPMRRDVCNQAVEYVDFFPNL